VTVVQAPPVAAVGWRHLCVTAGISYRQLDYWCRAGILEELRVHPGSGVARLFAPGEARVARAVATICGPYARVDRRAVAAAVRNHPGAGVLCLDSAGVRVVAVDQLLPLERVTSCLYLPPTTERTGCA